MNNEIRKRLTRVKLYEQTQIHTWFLLAVEKGVKAAEEGRLIDYKDIKAKWEAKLAAQMD